MSTSRDARRSPAAAASSRCSARVSTPRASSISADTPDYAAAAMRAKRTCCACGRIYDAESVQRDPGWQGRARLRASARECFAHVLPLGRRRRSANRCGSAPERLALQAVIEPAMPRCPQGELPARLRLRDQTGRTAGSGAFSPEREAQRDHIRKVAQGGRAVILTICDALGFSTGAYGRASVGMRASRVPPVVRYLSCRRAGATLPARRHGAGAYSVRPHGFEGLGLGRKRLPPQHVAVAESNRLVELLIYFNSAATTTGLKPVADHGAITLAGHLEPLRPILTQKRPQPSSRRIHGHHRDRDTSRHPLLRSPNETRHQVHRWSACPNVPTGRQEGWRAHERLDVTPRRMGESIASRGPRGAHGCGTFRDLRKGGGVRLRTVITALVAALLVGAYAASALAAPQVGRCVSQPGTGKYENSTCTKKAGSKPEEKAFEFLKNPILKGFTLLGGTESFLGEGGEQVFCAHESGSGEYLESGATPSTKQVHHVVLTMIECELENRSGGTNAICQTPGQSAGTIVTTSLSGKMGDWEPEASVRNFGQELHPESGRSRYTNIECSGGQRFEFATGHCVITVLGPENLMAQFWGWTFETRNLPPPSIQIPEHFVNSSHICHLEWSVNGGSLEEVVRHGGDTVKNEEALEIKG
jgi:hypothetical protein